MKNDWSTIKKLIWLKIQMGASGILKVVSGITPLTIANAVKGRFKSITQHGKVVQNGNPTTANPVDIVCNNGALKWDAVNSRIYADGTPEVLTVSATGVADQTATVENLLAVGPVADEQDIITGKVIRRTEVFRYDGTQTVKPTYMSTTGGKDDGAIIVQPRGAEYAGDVVSFEAEEGENIDSLSVTLTPTQDLHGYDAPWPAGGGNQKFNPSSWPYTTSRRFWGTEANDFTTALNALTAGTYTIVANIKIDALDAIEDNRTYGFLCQGVNVDGRNTREKPSVGTVITIAKTFTLTSDQAGTFTHCYWYAGAGNAVEDKATITDVGINVGSETSYIPFENLCPITGTDSCEVVRTGINVWDEEWEVGSISSATGVDVVSLTTIRSKNYIQVMPNTYYHFKSSDVLGLRFYDAEKRYLDYTTVNNGNKNTPSDCKYLRFIAVNTAEYANDISINYPATDTAYHAYDPLSNTLEVEWGALGKNLLNCEVVAYSTSRANIVNKDDGTTLFPLKAGTYTFSNNGSNAYAYWRKEGTTDNNIIHTSGGTNYGTFTLTEDANYMFWLYANSIDASEYTEIQLEKGSTKTTYEPYTKTIYGGHVDAVRGEMVVNRGYSELSEDWPWIRSSTYQGGYYANRGQIMGYKLNTPFMCSHAKSASNTSEYLFGTCYCDSSLNFRIMSETSTLQDWKDYIVAQRNNGTPITICYELSTPITIQIDPQTLTALRNNTVWADAGPVDVLLTEELIESVTPQKLKTAEGTNTISVTSEIGNVDLGVTYKTPV